ncbi:MAG TPA: aldo/keto reductase [Fimbriimonadaceae bacterium]|jgi:aryl-alcohol dehydrogenase-like predicted oxidoreductase
MEWTRPFGNTGFTVTALGLGGGQVGNKELSEAEAERFLNNVLDQGITLIDTARGYGLSEERIGKYISHRRSEFVLSTKVGYSIDGFEDWTPAIIPAGIERALKLLKTDVLDVVHLHSCPLETLKTGGVAEALVKCKEEGKIKIASYSGENEELEWAIQSGLFGSVQTSVNPTDQRSLHNYIPQAAAKGMGVIGKRPNSNAFWTHASRPIGDYSEEYWVRWHAMKASADGMDMQELVVRFATHAPGVSTAIFGTANVDHFNKNIELAKKGPLPEELIDSLTTAFKAHDKGWTGQI